MSMDYDVNPAPKSSRSYVGTLVLAFFLGWLGIHRFYTGYIVIGIIQLLTAGGFGIWSFIDLISIAINSYRDADGNDLDGYNLGCATLVGIVIILSFILGGLRTLTVMFAG